MGKKRAVSLEELEAEFRNISSRASALMQSADRETALRRPGNKSWSAAECIEHLNLSADPYFGRWADAIPRAPRRTQSDAPYRMDFWGGVLFWMLDPPPRLRFPTSRQFIPIEIADPGQTLERFLDRQERILGVIRTCGGLAVDTVKIASPFAASVHYSVWSSFVVTAAHERRHLWQAERAVAASGGRTPGSNG